MLQVLERLWQIASSGATSLTLDSVVGINTGDALSGTGIAAATVISSYNTGAKTITINNATTAGISTTAQVTITHGYDSNTDRGISFAFNSGSGISDNKTGFFGMDDSSIANSAADADNHGTHADDSRRWTYVPDASIANSVVTGTKDSLISKVFTTRVVIILLVVLFTLTTLVFRDQLTHLHHQLQHLSKS